MMTTTQLLFLDTFSHETTDLNLDIVQFPSSVVVEEVRVIPLGGKVHVNFPGGMNMRLGATLPNKFNLEFFVNDLTKTTASTFSSLGMLSYDHERQIRLCTGPKRILTDGLVLRGHYNAVTLAVYGTPATPEQLALMSQAVNNEASEKPPENPVEGQPIPVAHSPHKRKDWNSSWPPPVPDEQWSMENGQADYYSHRRHSRPRSPHSRSRSPPVQNRRQIQRRSVTPKSPPPPLQPNNGFSTSPTETKVTEAILDDVSDISDGDIPEDEAVSDKEEPIEEQDEKLPAVLADIPEDMEEISDEEADWSDDGDCFFLESVDVEFGPDWVDPVSSYKVEEHRLSSLRFYQPLSGKIESFEEDSSLNKMADLEGSEWVEALENLRINAVSSQLLKIMCRGLSFDEAMKHPVHTFKVRHLKSTLKFVVEILPKLKWSSTDLEKIIDALVQLICNQSVADPIRLQSLLALHKALDEYGYSSETFPKWSSEIVRLLTWQKLSTRCKIGVAAMLRRLSLIESFQHLDDENLPPTERLNIAKQIFSTYTAEETATLGFLTNEKCGIVQHCIRDMYNSRFPWLLVKWIKLFKDETQFETAVEILLTFVNELASKIDGLVFLAAFPSEFEEFVRLSKKFDLVHHCLHALNQIDTLSYLCQEAKDERLAMENNEILHCIRDLYGMIFSPVGRKAIVFVCSKGQMLRPIIRLVQHSGQVDEENQQKKDMKKSAIRGYACEILLMVTRLSDQVEYLHYYSDELFTLGKSDENSKLFELTSWLQWLASEQVWRSTLPQIDSKASVFLLEVVKSNKDKLSPMSCDLVMSIRFLHKLVEEGDTSSLLQVLDFCDHGIYILNKACGYHEQPHLHTATFAGYNGHLLISVIRMIVQILWKILRHRIACQSEAFQDTSAVSTLVKTFALCTVVPNRSDSHQASLETRECIIHLLMSFTTVPVDMSQDKTTVWQLMLMDIIKYTVSSPHTYLPGLKILSEILPQNATNQQEKNLWSAQLYGMEAQLKELISSLIPCQVGQLQKLLFETCHQMAQLSSAIAQIVADAVFSSLKNGISAIAILASSSLLKAAFLSVLRDADHERLRNLTPETLAILALKLLNPSQGLKKFTDFTDLQGAANNLPDRESSLILFNAVINASDFGLFAQVFENLSQSLLGVSLLRNCFKRTDLSRKMASYLRDKEEIFGGFSHVILKVSKFIGQSEMRELFDWTQGCFLNQEPFRSRPQTEKLVQLLSGEPYKVEDCEVEWPSMEPLRDQFSSRTEYFTDFEMFEVKPNEEQDLVQLVESSLPKDFDIQSQVKQVCDEKSLESEIQKKKAAKKSLLESKALANKNLISSFKAGGAVAIRGGRSVFNRGPGGQRPDLFRSRPPNTSRPPSLHVDDFLVLQSRGQQPTGPTGYNKQSLRAAQELFAEKEAKSKGSVVGFREATKQPVFDNEAEEQSQGQRPRNNERVSKNYRSSSSGNGRSFPRDRGWSHSPNRDNRPPGGGLRTSLDHRNRRSAKTNDLRRGKGDRSKGKQRGDGIRSGNARSIPR